MGLLVNLSAMSARAADPLTRLIGSPNAVNATLGYENVQMRHPFRRVKGEEVDLRPLFAWINRGKLSRSAKPFDQESPRPDWRPVDGTVISVLDDAVLVAKGISRSPVFVRNCPADLAAAPGKPLSIVAVEAGIVEFDLKTGVKEKVPVYDHGIPFTPPPAAITNVVTTPVRVLPVKVP